MRPSNGGDMGRTATDFAGQSFGRLEVIERARNHGNHAAWKCRCSCGNEVVAAATNLNRGRTTSCGCAIADANKARRKGVASPIKPPQLRIAPKPAKRPHGVERLLTHMGRRQNLQQWADEVGLSFQAIQFRLSNGWSVKRALTTPGRKWVKKTD